MDQDQVKQNILSGHQWLRMLFMVGYILASWVLVLVLLVIILVQTLIVLIMGETNHNLRRFGILCGVFIHQIVHFLVYGSDDKPFPFTEFPDIDGIDTENVATKNVGTKNVATENVATENVASEEVSKYTYPPSGVRSSPAAASTPAYDEIIPSTESVNPDDEFPAATDADSNPERLS